MSHRVIARSLADTLVVCPPEVDVIVDRWAHLFGRRWRWLRPLARRLLAKHTPEDLRRCVLVRQFILADPGFQRAAGRHKLRVKHWLRVERPVMMPSGPAVNWQLPAIHTAGELADWLAVSTSELEWFADLRARGDKRASTKLRHYHYRLLSKRFGQLRLIESPKPRLKALQTQVLREILDRIPAHDAAHGFCQNRSIKTFADPHVGKQLVIRIDLQDFFPSIGRAHVGAIFRSVGYPDEVANYLAGLCTNSVSLENVVARTSSDASDAMRSALQFAPNAQGNANAEVGWKVPREQVEEKQRLYSRPHLPQGAPTSPALANFAAYHLDLRLSTLAESAQANYTRYADDLAFSGDEHFARCAKRFHLHVCATVLEEGFVVHHRKTRMMRQGTRQQLAGIVVNKHPNIRRETFDTLKAILTNCVRHGPKSQNLAAHPDFHNHLLGRIAFVESINPEKGRRLRSLYDQIQW